MDARSDPSILQKHSVCPVWSYSCCTGIKPITLCTLISVRERAHNVNMTVLTRASRVYLTRFGVQNAWIPSFLRVHSDCVCSVHWRYMSGGFLIANRLSCQKTVYHVVYIEAKKKLLILRTTTTSTTSTLLPLQILKLSRYGDRICLSFNRAM